MNFEIMKYKLINRQCLVVSGRALSVYERAFYKAQVYRFQNLAFYDLRGQAFISHSISFLPGIGQA